MKNYVDDSAAIGIIGSADGPTAIFMTGPGAKLPLKAKIRNRIYQSKRRMAEKKISAFPHSLRDVAAYAVEHYHAVPLDPSDQNVIAQQKVLKECLLFRYKAEHPDCLEDEPVIPMDFQLYEIKRDDSRLEIMINYAQNSFGVSYSGKKTPAKQFKKITKELYTYYGVSEEDIQNKTERYYALLGVLSR